MQLAVAPLTTAVVAAATVVANITAVAVIPITTAAAVIPTAAVVAGFKAVPRDPKPIRPSVPKSS
jgi:hypothetical protein